MRKKTERGREAIDKKEGKWDNERKEKEIQGKWKGKMREKCENGTKSERKLIEEGEREIEVGGSERERKK